MQEIDKLKSRLASSSEWKQIKEIELDKIVNLSDGITDPLIIKGMLKTIYDIEHWQQKSEV